MVHVGDRLKSARLQARKTLRDAEEASGLSKDTISRIERGLSKPHVGTVAKLANVYGGSPEEFLEDEPSMTLDQIDLASLLELNKSLSNEMLKVREEADQSRLDDLHEQLHAVSRALIRKGPWTETKASTKRRQRQQQQESGDVTAETG